MKIDYNKGPVSKHFYEIGVTDFILACNYVQQLPYKRNSTKADKLIVLKDGCGTCSSKHELIKRLAEENKMYEYELVLCMFRMSAQNTPKVKPVLERYGLKYIPEAHTYITFNGKVIDVTYPENPELLYLKDILYTEEISAAQIRVYKVDVHKAYLQEWGEVNELLYSFDELWRIREECIEALSL